MDTSLPQTSDLSFGPYRLDGLNGLLWRGPRAIPLSPRPWPCCGSSSAGPDN
jgi:hypothetical protein